MKLNKQNTKRIDESKLEANKQPNNRIRDGCIQDDSDN